VRQIVNPLMAHRRRADSQRLRSWNKHSHCSHRPRHLLAFRRAHTQIKIHLAIGNSAQVAAGVEAASAELGFVEGAVESAHFTSSPVARDQLVAVVGRDHPWVGRSRPVPPRFSKERVGSAQ